MEFYDVLSEYYDFIFPLTNEKLNFLNDRIKKDSNVLDLACGTGSYTIALENLGNKVYGIDLDEKMIEIAKDKSGNLTNKIDFRAMNMLDIDKEFINETFDTIFCIGNSLVHLNNEEEILNLLKKIYSKLNEDGNIIIQIINYDRILKYNIDHLPTIINDDNDIKFVRNYEFDSNNNKMYFNTKIIVNKDDIETEFSNSTPLLPLKSKELEKLLLKAGFKEINFYGNFKEETYNIDSYATIINALK